MKLDSGKALWDLPLRLAELAWLTLQFILKFLLSSLSGFVGRRSESEVRNVQAQALTALFEQGGGAFLKFGQMLAMRPDFLPVAYISALSKLLDNIEPFATTVAIEILESELGKQVGEVFSEFQETPLASASFGQVHKARLKTGEWVAVKIQRPKVSDAVRVDLRILKFAAKAIDYLETLPPERMVFLYKEFARWTTEELDYRVEARNADLLRSCAGQDSIEIIPKVYWTLTTQRTLTLEYLDGISLKSIIEGKEDVRQRCVDKGISLEEVARNLIRIALHEAFESGRFHADPHAGNILVLPQNRIGLVDFGIVGFLGASIRERLRILLSEIFRGDVDAAFWAAVRVMDPPEYVNLVQFRRDYYANLERWLDVASDTQAPLEQRSSSSLILSNIEMMRLHGIAIRTAVVLFYRALVTIDILVLQIAPTVELSKEANVFLKDLRRRSTISGVNPDEIAFEYMGMIIEFPRRVSEMFATQKETRHLEMRTTDYLRKTRLRRLARLIGWLARLVLIVALLLFAVDITGWGVRIGVGAESMPSTLLAGCGLALALFLKGLARSLGRRGS